MPQAVKKILLVDDDDDLREALGEQLIMTEEFDVFEAGSGSEAIAQVNAGIFDLVILDLGLPKLGGQEVLRRLRDAGNLTPVIILTARKSLAHAL